jgi:hypothetical protein
MNQTGGITYNVPSGGGLERMFHDAYGMDWATAHRAALAMPGDVRSQIPHTEAMALPGSPDYGFNQTGQITIGAGVDSWIRGFRG